MTYLEKLFYTFDFEDTTECEHIELELLQKLSKEEKELFEIYVMHR